MLVRWVLMLCMWEAGWKLRPLLVIPSAYNAELHVGMGWGCTPSGGCVAGCLLMKVSHLMSR